MINELIIFSAKYLFWLSIAIAIFYFFATQKSTKKKLLVLTLVSFPLAYLLAKISSRFINDPRPFVTAHLKPLIPHIADNGFPSDHMLLTMTIASVLFVFNRKLGILATIIAICIGTARVLAQIHHSADIIGSSIIAIGATYISMLLINLAQTILKRNRP